MQAGSFIHSGSGVHHTSVIFHELIGVGQLDSSEGANGEQDRRRPHFGGEDGIRVSLALGCRSVESTKGV